MVFDHTSGGLANLAIAGMLGSSSYAGYRAVFKLAAEQFSRHLSRLRK